MGEFTVKGSMGDGAEGNDEIRDILDELLAEIDEGAPCSTKRIEFIESINDWYEEHGFLTEAQESAIRDIHNEMIG